MTSNSLPRPKQTGKQDYGVITTVVNCKAIILMNSEKNNNTAQYGIDKYSGSFDKEEGGCSIIVNATVNSITNMSAAGLYMYLICRPSNWNLNANQLANHFECHRETIYKAIDHLLCMHLLSRTEVQARENGKFSRYHYRVYLNPYKEPTDIDEISPCTENPTSAPCTVLPTTVIPTLINKEDLINKEKKIPPIIPQKETPSLFLTAKDLKADNPMHIPDDMLEEWMHNRKRFKVPVTGRAWERMKTVLTQLKDSGLDPKDCFEKMLALGWKGLDLKFFEYEINAISKNKVPTIDDRKKNEESIRNREIAAQKEKREEIEASKHYRQNIEGNPKYSEALKSLWGSLKQ